MEKSCIKCDNKFKVANWNKTRKFCSHKCYWSSILGIKKPDEQKVHIECAFCKKSCVRWNKGNDLNKFCSRECFHLNQRIVMKGRKLSEITKQKMAENMRGKTGESSHRWIKDRTKIIVNELDKFNSAYKEWMSGVKKRDNYTCKINNGDCSGRIEAHHILSYKDYPELRYYLNNGIALCHFHHPRRRKEEKRLAPEFQKLVSVSKE